MAEPERQSESAAAARAAVEDLLARYCMAVDDGRFDDFERLFDPDGAMHVMGSTHIGASAVRAFMEQAQPPEARGRHATSSKVLELDVSAGTGSGWVDYVFFDSTGTATNIGRYHDRYRRGGDGRWRFSLREIVFRGEDPAHARTWN